MAIRPPRNLFQKMVSNITEMKSNFKDNIIKYYLLYFLIICVLTFYIENNFIQLYEKYIFNTMVQLSFFMFFLKDLLTLKLCGRNKFIIYTFLIYFLGNIFLPFYITNENYIYIYSNIFNITFIILIAYTLFNSNTPKK